MRFDTWMCRPLNCSTQVILLFTLEEYFLNLAEICNSATDIGTDLNNRSTMKPSQMAFHKLSTLIFILCSSLCLTNALNLSNKFSKCLPSDFPVHFPGAPKYANLSTLNFRTDLSGPPAAIVTASHESHVSIAVRCASRAGLNVCSRSGGHSLAGYGLCSGVLIDVGNIRHVTWHGKYKVSLGAGLTTGEVLWKIWHQRRRWISVGVCPAIGLAGYLLGGGHGPYEGRQSIGCDSVLSYRMIDCNGNLVIVNNRGRNSDLFWAMCGAGGGQFGIVTQFRMTTMHSKPVDTAIVFRFSWPSEVSGELFEKYIARYGEEGGLVWFRMDIQKGQDVVTGYGACYKVLSGDPEDCVKRLKQAEFFNTPGRKTQALFRAKNAADTHAFYGPEGDWSRKLAEDPKRALLGMRYVDRETGNGRKYKSAFLKFEKGKLPDRKFWQTVADVCINPGRESIVWSVCEMNNFQNSINIPRDNAFAFRDADVIVHYIIGAGDEEDKLFAYNRMKELLQPYTIGVYVNYPELELGSEEYPKLYWGSSLKRLKMVKKMYNPRNFFHHSQPIPA